MVDRIARLGTFLIGLATLTYELGFDHTDRPIMVGIGIGIVILSGPPDWPPARLPDRATRTSYRRGL